MSRNYDNWERLVGVVLRREKDRRLAYCESLSSSSSAGLSSRFSLVRDIDESADVSIIFSRNINVKVMEYEEIRKATRNFTAGCMLGADSMFGGRGSHKYKRNCVYKGWIDGTAVAVAVAVAVENRPLQPSNWLEEEVNLSQHRHPNLVTPIGYYFDSHTRIFVHEFMASGSLDHHLFIAKKPLPWATRIKVAIGAARGLDFLHDLTVPVTNGVPDICHCPF